MRRSPPAPAAPAPPRPRSPRRWIGGNPTDHGFDLACSGDFLEHLPPERRDAVLAKIDGCAARAYHKIACFDDGHAHLSILPPEDWLARFRAIDPAYQLRADASRRADQPVAVISKGFAEREGG